MILNYVEASAYATQIAGYFILFSMGSIIFCWAWENIIYYFTSHVEADYHDEIVDALEAIDDSIQDVRSAIESEQQVEVNVG